MAILNIRHRCWAVALLLITSSLSAAADVVTVVSSQNPLTAISRNEIANIFLGKTNRFPDGQAAIPIDQPDSSSTHEGFYRSIANRRPADIKAYWSKMIFTGRGQPPRVAPDDEAVKEILAGKLQAIGYIDRKSVDPRVKVLKIQ